MKLRIIAGDLESAPRATRRIVAGNIVRVRDLGDDRRSTRYCIVQPNQKLGGGANPWFLVYCIKTQHTYAVSPERMTLLRIRKNKFLRMFLTELLTSHLVGRRCVYRRRSYKITKVECGLLEFWVLTLEPDDEKEPLDPVSCTLDHVRFYGE